MAQIKIKDFLSGRFFEIPKYQRGYAWEKEHIRDLFEDISESIEASSNHYIGTLVLSKSKKEDTFFVVDGQQRITSLLLILNAVLNKLPQEDKVYYKRLYISEGGRNRLVPLGRDKQYFFDILDDKKSAPENKSQRHMLDVYEETVNYIKQIKQPIEFLRSIERLEIMEFIQDNEGDAIRIFQTVNDRGKPLSHMEKAKSLLIYFSNRYLNKKLDSNINDLFGKIFEIYDDIKVIGEEYNLNPINNKNFDEDSIMRYHFISYTDEDYDATASYVLGYLKRNLNELRKSKKYNEMETFIVNYAKDLTGFFGFLLKLIEKIQTSEEYYKLFVNLSVSATLYPLLVKLESLKLLDKSLIGKDYKDYTFLNLLELIDVRIYKTRNTDPRADISRFTAELNSASKPIEIQDWLLWYNNRWMSKNEFQNYLNGYFYGNRALVHMFIDYCEYISNKKFDLKQLKKIEDTTPTIEHILSQKPKFSYRSHGFKNEEDYLEYEHTLGNLTLLEKKINSGLQNKGTLVKVKEYDKSFFSATKSVSSLISKNKIYNKDLIKTRTEELAKYFSERWWC